MSAVQLHCAHGYLLHEFLSPLSSGLRTAFRFRLATSAVADDGCLTSKPGRRQRTTCLATLMNLSKPRNTRPPFLPTRPSATLRLLKRKNRLWTEKVGGWHHRRNVLEHNRGRHTSVVLFRLLPLAWVRVVFRSIDARAARRGMRGRLFCRLGHPATLRLLKRKNRLWTGKSRRI